MAAAAAFAAAAAAAAMAGGRGFGRVGFKAGRPSRLFFFFLRKPGFHSLIFGDYSPKCKDTLKRNRKYIPVLEHSRSFSPPAA